MSWFSQKPKPSEPKQAEPQPPAPEPKPSDDEITLTVKCMKCDERFEVTFSPQGHQNVARTLPAMSAGSRLDAAGRTLSGVFAHRDRNDAQEVDRQISVEVKTRPAPAVN
jgi:hypothetical protein